MIRIVRNETGAAYGIKDFVLDTMEEDMPLLKQYSTPFGSRAYVIDTKQYYILNGKNEWVPYQGPGGGGSSVPGGGNFDGGDIEGNPEGGDFDGGDIDPTPPSEVIKPVLPDGGNFDGGEI